MTTPLRCVLTCRKLTATQTILSCGNDPGFRPVETVVVYRSADDHGRGQCWHCGVPRDLATSRQLDGPAGFLTFELSTSLAVARSGRVRPLTDLPALVGNTLQRAQRFTHREINVPLRDSPRDERGRQWESRGQGGGRRAEDPEQRARHCPRMCPAWICPGADQPAPALTEEPSLLPFADQGLSCVTADLWAWPPDDERDEESHTEREREPPEPQAKPRGTGSGGGNAPDGARHPPDSRSQGPRTLCTRKGWESVTCSCVCTPRPPFKGTWPRGRVCFIQTPGRF